VKKVAFAIVGKTDLAEIEVSDALYEFIRSALLNASPSSFGDFQSSDDGHLHTVDGFLIDLDR
jgi:hypothetical protein